MQFTDSQPSDTRRPAPRRRRWIALALALGALPLIAFALVAVTITLVLATPTGSRLAIEWLVARTQGALAVDQVQGSAWTGLSAGQVRWVDPSLIVEAQDLALRLDWSSVLRRQPVIDQLTVRRLSIAKPASDAPVQLPASLRLPIHWQVQALQLDAVIWQQGGANPIALEAVSLAAAYGAGRYRVEQLQVTAFDSRLRDARLELEDRAPFPIRVAAQLETEPARLSRLDPTLRARLADERLVAELAIEGSLADLQIALDARYAGMRAQARWSVDPLATAPDRPLAIQLEGVDPSRFGIDAPAMMLGATATFRPTTARLELDVSNSLSGRLDQQRLPVERVLGELAWQRGALQIDGLMIDLGAGARIEGAMRIDTSRQLKVLSHQLPWLDASLQVSALDPRAVHAGWPASRLDAQVRIEGERMQWVLPDPLGDRSLAVDAALRLEGEQVAIESLVASLPFARLQGSGRVSLVGAHRFAMEGRLSNVDPRRLLDRLGLDAPQQVAGSLNGEVRMDGALIGPQRRADLTLALHDSRIAGQRLSASMRAGFQEEPRRVTVDSRLDWGGNALTARGAVGGLDDRLRLAARLERPDLVDRRLSGTLRAEAELTGAGDRPAVTAKITAPRLSIQGGATVADAELAIEAADVLAAVDSLRRALAHSGPLSAATTSDSPQPGDPAVRLIVAAREIQLGGQSLQQPRFDLSGTADAHAIRLIVRAAGQQLALTGEGRIGAPVASRPDEPARSVDEPALQRRESQADEALLWSLRLDSLAIDGVLPVRLAAGAVRVDLARGSVGIERLVLALEGGKLLIDEARWSARGVLIRGAADSVSLRPLIDWLEGTGPPSRVGAPASANPPSSASAVADARADAAERLRNLRLNARWSLAGPDLDSLDGNLMATLRADPVGAKPGARTSTPAPASGIQTAAQESVIGDNRIELQLVGGRLDGEANLAIPSLRFSRRYTAPDWTLDGELRFGGRVRGTLRSPELVGSLRAQRLSLFNRSLGWRLRDGTIDARFDGRELTIDAIRFASGDGSLTIAGALRLADRPSGRPRSPASDLPVEGRLQLDARRLPVPLGPGQRLLLSGLSDLIAEGGELSWRGQLRADEGLIELRSAGVPELPADIRVIGDPKPVKPAEPSAQAAPGWTPRIGTALTIALGDSLRVRGGGVEARLGGELTLSGMLPAAPRVRGLVDVRDGTFSAYGRRLEITRGLIRFSGELDNPALDIVAMRRDQQVEAGVAVTGSAQSPRIRLVSEPDLPDAQKLAWLVLGTGLDDVSNAGQARALSEAALALLGRSDEGLIAGLTQRLGIDAVSVGASGAGARDRVATARLAPPVAGGSSAAGASGSAAAASARQEVVTVSKRLSSRLTLSYERGLSGLWNLVRLQYDITNRLSLRAQSGSENALDLLYFWWFD